MQQHQSCGFTISGGRGPGGATLVIASGIIVYGHAYSQIAWVLFQIELSNQCGWQVYRKRETNRFSVSVWLNSANFLLSAREPNLICFDDAGSHTAKIATEVVDLPVGLRSFCVAANATGHEHAYRRSGPMQSVMISA